MKNGEKLNKEENETMKLYEDKINNLVESVKKKEIPNLNLAANKKQFVLGKYAKLKLQFLKENKAEIYTVLLMKNELNKYLFKIEQIARKMENKIKKNTEEIILNEFIYK